MSGLYLHIPFCHSKCSYCDFFSVEATGADIATYASLLEKELQLKAVDWQDPISSIFFGGGTPSRLSPDQVDKLLRAIDDHYTVAADAEITLEANPGDVTPAILSGYLASGINRLSFGMQSFQNSQLAALGRRHDSREARAAFHAARRAGFDNLSCDLIFALPGQTTEDLARDCDELIALGPEHVSCYALTLEEGTPLLRQHLEKPLPLPDDEESAEQFLYLHERLSAAGYEHYEISNYARPGCECRHNQNTWRRQPYLGVGAGAHSFVAHGWGERRANPCDLEHYRQALQLGDDPSVLLETFERHSAMSETLYLALRTAEGIDPHRFQQLFATPLEKEFAGAAQRCGNHLLKGPHGWHFTPSGWLLYDHLVQHFLP